MLQYFKLKISLDSVQFQDDFGKFPKFPYRGGKYLKVGNYCGNLSLPIGNLLDSDLRTLQSSACSLHTVIKKLKNKKFYRSVSPICATACDRDREP